MAMKQKLQLPHRKRDIHESRAANTRPHFVFLVFMATIEKGSLHTYSKLKKGYHTWESIKKKYLQLLVASWFFATVSAYSHVGILWI